MPDEFKVYCDLPDRSNLSATVSKNVDHGGFKWSIEISYNSKSSHPLVTLRCQPDVNKETLIWRCDTMVEIVAFRDDLKKMYAASAISHPFVFNSHMKSPEYQTEYYRRRSASPWHLEIKVEIFRSFVIDASSPNSELVLGIDDAARIKIDGRVVYLSKKILNLCSPFFDAMFNGDFLEKRTGSDVLRDVDFQQFMHLVAIAHRKTAFIDASSVGYLVTLADFYDFRDIVMMCKNFLHRADDELENRDRILGGHLGEEKKVVIDSNEGVVRGTSCRPQSFDIELGNLRCVLNVMSLKRKDVTLQFDCSPKIPDSTLPLPTVLKRSLMWRSVIGMEVDAQFKNPTSDVWGQFEVRQLVKLLSSHHPTAAITFMVFNSEMDFDIRFCLKLIESDVVDLSSPANELIKDPEDAVCLQVDGEKLWFSRKVIALACPPLAEIFKETKSFYVIENVNFSEFMHFMAVLHSEKFKVDAKSVEYLLGLAERFNCCYMLDRCELFLRAKSRFHLRVLVRLAERFNLIGLLMKLRHTSCSHRF